MKKLIIIIALFMAIVSYGQRAVKYNISQVYPSAGIPISTGTGWAASMPDYSTYWNLAYSWAPYAFEYDAPNRGLIMWRNSENLTVTLPLFSSTNAGLAPSSGGGTSNFLRADGSWAAPTITVGSTNQVIYNNGSTLTGSSAFTFDGTNVTSAGTFTGTNFILSSDKRLKNNIQSIGSNEWIDEVHFKSFYMNNDLTGRLRYGVIAQEVEKINPYLVYTNEQGYKSVSYIDLLVAKVARQDEIINDLIKRIEKLEKNEK